METKRVLERDERYNRLKQTLDEIGRYRVKHKNKKKTLCKLWNLLYTQLYEGVEYEKFPKKAGILFHITIRTQTVRSVITVETHYRYSSFRSIELPPEGIYVETLIEDLQFILSKYGLVVHIEQPLYGNVREPSPKRRTIQYRFVVEFAEKEK